MLGKKQIQKPGRKRGRIANIEIGVCELENKRIYFQIKFGV